MSETRRLLDELRRTLAMEIEAGRGLVLDAGLRAKIEALRPSDPASERASSSSRPFGTSSGTLAERRARMAALAARAESCTRCALHASRHRVVTGAGDLDVGLMLIGEAPGHDEDQSGEPFVGRAGQLLNRILAAIGLDRSEVYIANVLKCRPPDNRPPAPAEVASCSPFLFEQIELVRPRVICALGRHAAMTLLRSRQSLAEMRGRVHDYRGIPVVVTYHPSALLRDASYKRPTWEDMQMVQRLLAGAPAGEPVAEPLAHAVRHRRE